MFHAVITLIIAFNKKMVPNKKYVKYDNNPSYMLLFIVRIIETVSEVFAISSQFITKSSIMIHNVYHTLKRMHQDSKHNLFAYTMFYYLFYTYIDTLHFLPSNLHLQSHELFLIDIFASFILFIILNEFKCSSSVYLDRIF